MAEALILLVIIVVAIKLYQSSQKAKQDKAAISRERERVELNRQCQEIIGKVYDKRNEAFSLPPRSNERAESVRQAKGLVRTLQEMAQQRPEMTVGNADALLEDLDVIERSDIYAIKPRSEILPEHGSVLIAFVDTETTGLRNRDEPISVGIVLMQVELPKGHLVRKVDSFYGLREPKVPINRFAKAVHGLSLDDLRGKAIDIPRLRGLIEQADVLIAHNAKFDKRMLAQLVPEVNDWPWRCSLRQVRWPKELENKKLDTICLHFGVERQLPHNALADAQAMADCLFQLTGKTARSRSLLADCLSKECF